jgi:cellulose synthase/poly-beta-1,6-N-acetylglucosamine synthase-like glycosyltransferase
VRKVLSGRITVGICAYNEERNINTLLHNIVHEQELPPESEVMVVCSGCVDQTVDIVREYANSDSRVKLHVETERKGKASAINHILSKASGNVVLFVSADTLPVKRCFARLLSKLRDSNVGIVCGNPVPTNPQDSLVGRLVKLLWSLHGEVFAQLNDAGLARHATEIFCIRRGIVEKIPAGTVNDDAYIAVTAKKKGWLVKYESAATVLIHGPETFPEYFSQRRRILWGHHQIKKLTGEPPQHLVYLLPLYPIRVFRLLLWLCSKHAPSVVLAFVSTELLVNAVAAVDVFRGKSYSTWNIVASTKKGVKQQT